MILLLAAGCSRSPRVAPSGPPDLVLVTLDTTRADHLGAWGWHRDTSPALDALAARSVRFERFVVPMATTLPTHTSILTGTWPEEHGILANVSHGGERFVPSEHLDSLATWARDRGYATAAFVSATPLKRGTGIEAGFDHFDQPRASQRRAHRTTGRALEWLEDAGPGPVLLWVHYYDPHRPWDPPRRHDRFRHGEALDAWLAARQVPDRAEHVTGEWVQTRPGIDDYDGEVHAMDHHLGRLVEAVDRLRGADRVVLVVAGDHGEGLGQHGVVAHGDIWDEQLHAPFLVRAPGLEPRVETALVSAPDVLPTVLGQVELPGEEELLAQVSGRDALAPGFEPRPVVSRTPAREEEVRRTAFALTTPEWKLVRVAGGEAMLFDLGEDPYELRDVAGEEAEVVKALTGVLEGEIGRQRRRAKELGSGRTEEADAGLVEQLRELGYAE